VLLVAGADGAERLLDQLRRGGYEPESRRVDSQASLLDALTPEAWEVVICEDDIPTLGGPTALALIKSVCPNLPVIIVSSTFGESVASAAMKAGADDFLARDFLARLVPAVEREIRLVETRRGWSRAARSLKETEDFYRDLVEHSEVLICVHDLEGRVLTANDAAARSLGYDQLLSLGRQRLTIRDIMTPESRDDFDRYIETIRRDGSATGVMAVRTLQGETRYWQYQNTLRTEGLEQPVVRGIAIDVTERLRTQEELRESQDFLEKAQEVGQIGSWISEVATGRLVWSRETSRIFGLAAGEFDGRLETFVARVHPEDREKVRTAGRAAVEHGEAYDLEHRIVRPDGSVRWVHERASVVRDGAKHPVKMIGVVQDVTERRQLEEQLRQSQKMEAVGRLAGGVAHDFNNLLTAILGYSDLVISGLPENSPLRADAEEIRRAGERAASLTRQLLAFGRKQMLEPCVLDLNVLVTNLGRMLGRLIGADVELVTALGPDLWRIRADPGQLEQIVVNLAVNARDAMPQGGKLTIETSNAQLEEADGFEQFTVRSGSYVMLVVRDEGVGMDEETRSRIFEPFFTTKERGKGTGLGLATVYGIVKQSGGYVWVDSEPGRGTAFRIYLPRCEPTGDESNRSAATPSEETPRGTETVLLVEDEDAVRQLARRLLRLRGYTVLEASGGDRALELLTQHVGPIHLLLTDVVMPGMTGLELASRVAALRPDTRTLLMSGHVDRAALDPSTLLLQKPFTPEGLARKVREALDAVSDSLSSEVKP
jgi:two-component system cell cycle sensor histidine kinase/response regulator CckA